MGEPSKNDCGFSLLELVIIVLILSAMITILPHIMRNRSIDLRNAVTGVTADLRTLRQFAVDHHVKTTLIVSANTYTLMPQSIVKTLPPDVSVELNTIVAPNLFANLEPGLRFYPDGSSSGGIIEFKDKSLHASMAVRWFDGGIYMNEK